MLTRGAIETEDPFVRGYGWAYIDAVSAVTQGEIGNALRAEEEGTEERLVLREVAVEKIETVRYVVAVRGPPDNTLLILKIVGGLVYDAVKHEFERVINEQEVADETARSLERNGDETLQRTREDGTYAELLEITDQDTANTYANIPLDNRQEWGEAIIKAYEQDEATADEIELYISNVDAAFTSNDIKDPEEFTDPIVGQPEEFTGTSGEVERAIDYANAGWTVKPQPFQEDDFDLELTKPNRKEFVEVKTREIKKPFNFQWILRQFGAINKKLDNVNERENTSISEDNVTLDLKVKNSSIGPSEAENRYELAINSYGGDLHADEVNIILSDGTTISKDVE